MRQTNDLPIPQALTHNRLDDSGQPTYWDTASVHEFLSRDQSAPKSLRSTERWLLDSEWIPAAVPVEAVRDERGEAPIRAVQKALVEDAKRRRLSSFVVQLHRSPSGQSMLFGNDGRGGRRWLYVENLDADLPAALNLLADGRGLMVWPHGEITAALRELGRQNGFDLSSDAPGSTVQLATGAYRNHLPEPTAPASPQPQPSTVDRHTARLTHLDRLEAESIYIMREVAAQAENPVMLYSVGKDSSVMLRLAQKAFYPSRPPFPLMHVDTRWKFQEMYQFRDRAAKDAGMELIVHINPDGVAKNINPFDHGSALHTDIMKTEGLKQALDQHKFDVAFGGARRDEEKSRAKERIFSFRNDKHRWDPKAQRPELWNLYNGYRNPGESIRVFPLSNWTEIDIWHYIHREQIPIVPLYFAAERPVVQRDGMLLLVDDDRLELGDDERVMFKKVRFRTLGCYPLSGAIESDAVDLSSIILEILGAHSSEREGRAIDSDSSGSMEKKKQQGYF